MQQCKSAGREAASRRTSCDQRCCAYRRVPFSAELNSQFRTTPSTICRIWSVDQLPAGEALASGLDEGTEKRVSSKGTFCSTFSTLIWEREELPLGACSTENG